jgi:hypothetical protein
VDLICAALRRPPPTVYSSSGGNSGCLATLSSGPWILRSAGTGTNQSTTVHMVLVHAGSPIDLGNKKKIARSVCLPAAAAPSAKPTGRHGHGTSATPRRDVTCRRGHDATPTTAGVASASRPRARPVTARSHHTTRVDDRPL